MASLWKNETCLNSVKPHNPLFEVISKFEYPFNDEQIYINNYDNCKLNLSKTREDIKNIKGNYKSESEFFVFTGVATFLFCLVALLYYVMFEDQERSMYATDVGKCSFVVIVSERVI